MLSQQVRLVAFGVITAACLSSCSDHKADLSCGLRGCGDELIISVEPPVEPNETGPSSLEVDITFDGQSTACRIADPGDIECGSFIGAYGQPRPATIGGANDSVASIWMVTGPKHVEVRIMRDGLLVRSGTLDPQYTDVQNGCAVCRESLAVLSDEGLVPKPK